MEVTNILEEGWYEESTGDCMACLQEDQLDGYGLCARCHPPDPHSLKVLVELLAKPYTLTVSEGEPSENE